MSTKNHLTKYVFATALILLTVLGIYMAYRLNQNEILVKGSLGLAVLYLLFFYIRFSGIDESLDAMLSDSKRYKYLIYALVGPGVAFLAMGGVFDMVSMLLKFWK